MAKQNQVKSRRKLLNPVFHLQTKEEEDTQLTKGLIKIVRRTGQLNLSGRSLANVPERLFTMYELGSDEKVDLDFNKKESDAWWDFQPLTYIDMSSNTISEIPSQFGMFEDLTVLNLQDNCLTGLPPEIGNLRKLTKLNLCRNKINKLPVEFYKLTELQVLLMSHNCLESVTADFGDLVMLQVLDLSHNQLTKLPPGFGYLVRLSEINLSYNKLTHLPPDIVNIRALLKLEIVHNNLKELPKLGELRKLQFLYATHNDIEDLPDFEGCENVQQLYFGNNFIKSISAEFCENMPHLKILELRDNQIESLPNEIAMLQNLIRLDLTNNELVDLPNSLGLLPHLQNLQMEGNKLKRIRTDVIKGGTMRILKHLREQLEESEIPKSNASNLSPQISIFPDKYQMRNSRALNVTMKDIRDVPDDVFRDASEAEVTAVDLCKNKLCKVPEGLKLIANNITELNLSLNQFKDVPSFIGQFAKLQYLDLRTNYLDDLPAQLGELHKLRELNLANNRFAKIPQCVFDMVGLEILILADNQIEDLPVERIKLLNRLAVFDVSNNNITHVPPELGNMKHLRSLQLNGNRFRQPRYAILEQGTESILAYLRDRIPQKK